MSKSPVDLYRVGQDLDRRRKIPVSEHAMIKNLRNLGWSWSKLAKKYEVDRRLIMFIVHPERQMAARRNHDWREYYTTERRREDMRKHRAYKKLLIQSSASNITS